ncbi:MAG: amino acid ABC transporter permease [Christensenellales bacterium]|jgi:His/Glu/Gln/Arg/opine family amino acid ABC transporter permease subunit
MQLKFDILIPYLPQFGGALLVTLQVTFSALLLGIVLAIPLSLFKILPVKPLNWIAAFYTSIFRGVPLMVQVFMMYFGIPLVTGLRFTAFQAGTLVFAMNSAAYLSESLRGGIMAIDRGQYEAAAALGIRYPGMMKDIIFPQAIKSVMPSIVNEFISLLKNTTLIASIGLVDILRVGQSVQTATYRAFEPFFFISVFYYVLVMLLSLLGKLLERQVNKSDRH